MENTRSSSTRVPRKWERHFRWNGVLLVGKTAIGHTTNVAVMAINHDDMIDLRARNSR